MIRWVEINKQLYEKNKAQRELIDLAIQIFKAQECDLDCCESGYPWSEKTEKMIHDFFFKEGDLG